MTLRCDVLAVGTELLLGQIIDSNSAWIGGELAANGIDSLVQVKVGDNVGRIETQLRRLLDSADAVIMCGPGPDPRRPHPRCDRCGDGRRTRHR
jgi:nicotinamide-nucleotide amidase